MVLKNMHGEGAHSRPVDLTDGLPASRSGGSAVGAAKRLPMRAVATLCAFALVVVASVGALALPAFAAPGDGANAPAAVYVSSSGSDENDGTLDKPYQTLAHAVSEAPSGATVYVMTNLTMSESARFWNKHLTITSIDPANPVTLSRGDSVATAYDQARKNYNPALIEVNGTNGAGSASLALSNIVIDDGGVPEDASELYYVQADSEGDGVTEVAVSEEETKEVQNTDIVWDAMIATYNGVATITLEDGAVLKNYGGMSAVRVSDGELVMKPGSRIIDDQAIDRVKGASGSFGPAGAAWLQGGTLTMEEDSAIGGSAGATMNGRAVYADGGSASIGGTLQNLTGLNAMWNGQLGVAVHLRAGASAVLTATGSIDAVAGTSGGNNSAIWTQFCNFTAEAGSLITEVSGFYALYFDDLMTPNYTHKVLLNGTISDCATGGTSLMNSWYAIIELGETGVVENCSSSSAGGLLYTNNGSKYVIKGTIQNNVADRGMMYIANQGGGRPEATIESTARIVNNSGLGIRVNNGALVTMNGGEISGNTGVGVMVSGKSKWKGVSFVMNGGTIANNGGVGVDCAIGGNASVMLGGGAVYGNGDGIELRVWNDYTDAPNAYPQNDNDHLNIASGVLKGDRTVQVQYGYDSFLGAFSLNRTLGTITLDEDYGSVCLAYAKHPDAAGKIKELVRSEHSGWTVIGDDAYWIKAESTNYHFTVTRPKGASKTGLFVAYIPLNEDGTVPDDAELVALDEVENADQIDVTLRCLEPGTAYAVMFANNAEYTLAPDDVTVYQGGGQSDEKYDNGGFPMLTVFDSVDLTSNDLESLEVNGEGLSSTPEASLLDQLVAMLEVTYYDADGNKVNDDRVPGEYTAKLSLVDEYENATIRINGNETNLCGEGTLIVRHTSNVEGAEDGTITYDLMESEPSTPVKHAEAIAKTLGTTQPKFYLNDDEGHSVENTGGVQLLDDELLSFEDDNREELLKQKAAEYLNDAGELQDYRYDFHYLDLVDAYNGNAWVSASYGTTVYLPYPEGVTRDTAESLGVEVVHYKDLHREYGISGQADVEQAIEECELETMDAEFTEQGIRFDVERAGFSPFAVVWEVPAYTITASAGAGGSISPEDAVSVGEGMDATFAITPDEGYEISQILVDGQAVGLSGIVGADGSATYVFEDVRADHAVSVSFTKTGGGIVVPPVEKVTLTYEENGGAPLDDVIVSAGSTVELATPVREGYTFEGWYFDEGLTDFAGTGGDEIAISDDTTVWAAWSRTGVPDAFTDDHVNYIVGRTTGEGSLIEPLADVTRAEVAAMVFRLLDDDVRADALASGEGVAFPDVAEGTWYTESVAALASLGAIEGYPDGYFRPDQPITRAEFAAIVTRLDNDFVEGEWYGDLPYTDVLEDHWAQSVLSFATNRGWLMGDSSLGVTFRPDDTIERAEAMAVLNRVLQRLPGTEADLIDDRIVWPDNQDPTAWYYLVVEEATNAHDHALKDDGVHERWTALLPNVDWDGVFAAKEDAAA